MKAFANSLHEAWLSGTTSFWTFIPECSFFATEGCFPESGSFDEFWTPSSEFQVAWKFYKQGVPWSFFSQQGNSEYRKDAKKQLHLHSEHPPIWYIGITSRHQKNHIMRLCHPSFSALSVVQEALESCSLQSIWTSRRDRSWWFWLGRSQRNLCRSTCLVALLSRMLEDFSSTVNNVTLESMMAVSVVGSPSRTSLTGEVSWLAWSSWQNLGIAHPKLAKTASERERKLPQKDTTDYAGASLC